MVLSWHILCSVLTEHIVIGIEAVEAGFKALFISQIDEIEEGKKDTRQAACLMRTRTSMNAE